MRKTDKKYFEKMVEDKDLVKESFNTDDGIRRAAIVENPSSRYASTCFNTDDGIRRAAISTHNGRRPSWQRVSIPMTVLGGLQ